MLNGSNLVRTFYENTRQVNIYTGLALFLILVSNLAPASLNSIIIIIFQLSALIILVLAVYKTYTATQTISKNVSKKELLATAGLQTNIRLSYGLLLALCLILLYNAYTIFFTK